MIVFKGGYYYTLVEDIKRLNEFTQKAEKGSIFCKQNITGLSEEEYHFTLWPTRPLDSTMEIYFRYDLWNGITVSKLSPESFTEVWWCTSSRANTRTWCCRSYGETIW